MTGIAIIVLGIVFFLMFAYIWGLESKLKGLEADNRQLTKRVRNYRTELRYKRELEIQLRHSKHTVSQLVNALEKFEKSPEYTEYAKRVGIKKESDKETNKTTKRGGSYSTGTRTDMDVTTTQTTMAAAASTTSSYSCDSGSSSSSDSGSCGF